MLTKVLRVLGMTRSQQDNHPAAGGWSPNRAAFDSARKRKHQLQGTPDGTDHWTCLVRGLEVVNGVKYESRVGLVGGEGWDGWRRGRGADVMRMDGDADGERM